MASWWWIVYALAVARVTGLITTDEITRPARDALLRRLDPDRASHQQLAYLTGCPWCMSIWVAAAIIPAAWYAGDHPALAIPALVLAASYITGATATLGR